MSLGREMESINNLPIELTIVLGESTMPVNHSPKMVRSAVIELTTLENEELSILANNMPIAKGRRRGQG